METLHEHKRPVLGILSLLLPLLPVVLWWLFESSPDLEHVANGYLGLALYAALAFFTPIAVAAGLVAGGIALVRGERPVIVPLVGIALTVGIVMWFGSQR
jgi:hypothetical protein